MAEYIDKSALYEKIAQLEELAGNRYFETPSNSPCYSRYMAQFNERTAFKHIIADFPSADVAPVRRGRWDDEHKCTVCRNEAFCKISNIQPDYDYDWEENLVETGGYIWDTEWLETTYCPHCGAKMDGGAD